MRVRPSAALGAAHLLGLCIGEGLSLLPALVEAKERSSRVNPLDEAGACAQRGYNVVPGSIHLLLAPGRGVGERVSTLKVNIWRLSGDCLNIIWRLLEDYLETTWRPLGVPGF